MCNIPQQETISSLQFFVIENAFSDDQLGTM